MSKDITCKDKYIVSFSGVKDSTAMLLKLIEKNMPIDEIVFCDTGKEFPDMINHIKKVEDYIQRPITILKPEKSFDYIFTEQKRKETSKFSNLDGYGWPSAKRRWCTTMLKKDVFKKYIKNKYSNNYKTYIGLAYDEQKRVAKNKDKHVLYPLCDWKMTEADCLKFCYDKGFDWNGLYKIFKRVSCYLCPMQSKGDWLNLEKHYPDLFADAIRLDKLSCYKFSLNESLEQRITRWHKTDYIEDLFNMEQSDE